MNNERTGEEIQIDLKDCFTAVLKRWYVVALAMLAGILVSALVCVVGYQPQYSAQVKLYVNNRSGTTSDVWSQTDITASRQLVKEYLVVLKARPTMDKTCSTVNTRYGYNLDYQKLNRMVEGDSIDSTTVFYVKVTDTSPDRAVNIVNAIADTFPEEVEKIFESSSARVIEYAVEASYINPGFATKIIIGALLGIVLACVYAVIMGVFVNDAIDSDEWLINAFDAKIPVLGLVPDEAFEAQNHGKYYTKYYTSSKQHSSNSHKTKENGGSHK